MRHPAKFSQLLWPALTDALQGSERVLDPFAGTGVIHKLAESVGADSVGVEIEPEWATMHPKTIVGDALTLPFEDESFDAICTSPTYANRMADHHEAKDTSFRNTYRHTLGRPLHEHNSGQLQWGEAYRNFHAQAWAEAVRVLKPGGKFILNISDHVRKGKVIPVSEWHKDVLVFYFGLTLLDDTFVETPRARFGANAHIRVSGEHVYTLQK